MRPPDDHQPLERLAELCGIQLQYRDIWGAQHRVPERTVRLLLGAMGLDTSSDEALRAELSSRLEGSWRRPLPPVLVCKQGQPAAAPLSLPDPGTEQPLDWTLELEDGSTRSGSVVFGELDELERRELEGEPLARRRLPLPADLPPGYHRLRLQAGGGEPAQMRLIVAPPRCYMPPELERGQRVWGPAVQLYSVRSRRDWGAGDLTDLLQLVQGSAELGSSLVGLNPMHALFPHNPAHESPYCPSSRRFLNVMVLDPEATVDFAECAEAQKMLNTPEVQGRLRELRELELVDHAGVAAVKRPLLERLYRHFCEQHLGAQTDRGRAFREFQRREGRQLRLHALYEALQEHFFARDQGLWGWPVWPEACRHPDAPEVAAFERQHLERVELFEYLQWQADMQLAAVAKRCRELGLPLGIYLDLSVSVDRAGSEIWSEPGAFALQASVGAPPDALGPQGQNWGLPPLIPERLQDAAYEPFVATLRRCMRHASALRIDHVMGLYRLFWIPEGDTPAEGAYVRYPVQDLLGIVALESQRNRCLIVGEDLGTVPDEVRKILEPAGVLSYRLLMFEQDDQGFIPPDRYPAQALVAFTTHDLPTLTGFWEGEDLALRDRLQLYPSAQIRQDLAGSRDRDRRSLLLALEREGLLPAGMDTDPARCPRMTDELAAAIYRLLARSPSLLMMLQPEDLLGQRGQANLPGTTFEHPNWKRRLPLPLEDWLKDPRVLAVARALRAERGRGEPSA